MVTGSDLDESRKAVSLAEEYRTSYHLITRLVFHLHHNLDSIPTTKCPYQCTLTSHRELYFPIPASPYRFTPTNLSTPAGLCYATIGVHPCSAQKFTTHPNGPNALLSSLEQLALTSKAAGTATAFGEIGLDYDRLFLCPKDIQLQYFEAQLQVAVRVQLPLFLHSRAAHADFVRLLKSVLGEELGRIGKGGLVHSFTGTVEEMRELVGLGLHVGVNGCSMKTEENLEVVRAIPLDRLQIETDGPWVSLPPPPPLLPAFFPNRTFPLPLLPSSIGETLSSFPLPSSSVIFTIVRNPPLARFLTSHRHRAPSPKSSQERKMGTRDDGQGEERAGFDQSRSACRCERERRGGGGGL